MSYALRIPDFFKVPPGGGIKPPVRLPSIPPIEPPGGLGAGVIGGTIGAIIYNLLFPPPTAKDALDEIGFEPFFYQPRVHRPLAKPPFTGGQEQGAIYEILAQTHTTSSGASPYGEPFRLGSQFEGKVAAMRLDVLIDGNWVVHDGLEYSPVGYNPSGTTYWRTVEYRAWVLANPLGDDNTQRWIQGGGGAVPGIKLVGLFKFSGSLEDDGNPPVPETDTDPVLLRETDPDNLKLPDYFPEPFPDLSPYPDPVKTPTPDPDPDPEPKPPKEPEKIGFPLPSLYPGRKPGGGGEGYPPHPIPDLKKPRKPGKDGHLEGEDGEGGGEKPDRTPRPPITKVDFDCEKLKDCLNEGEPQECKVKKEDAELQTQTCDLQEDGTYLAGSETHALSVPEGMGEALAILNQQIAFLFEKACNTTKDTREINTGGFGNTDFFQVSSIEVLQVTITIVTDPVGWKTIPASHEQQWVYFAGYIVWTKNNVSISRDQPIRRRSQVFIAPSGANGFFAYADNAASIEGTYLYKDEV